MQLPAMRLDSLQSTAAATGFPLAVGGLLTASLSEMLSFTTIVMLLSRLHAVSRLP